MNTYEQLMELEIRNLGEKKTEQEIRVGNSCPQCRTATLNTIVV